MNKIISTVLAAEIETVDDVATLQGFEGVFENIVTIVLGFGGIILFIMLIMGGFRFITAGGDPKAIEGAKKTLTYAIGGIVLVALSFLILRFISTFTGVDVTQFKIFQGN
ncbi:pilin [Patescibacteria group bacterium]|nr:pilin [Patescibacteria group bacterium]MBU0776695.1 pilin [Patescibacteria group bacterium]MBU0846139.1 pilin [Patescibacteria group bacterium]MBU0922772.1 pilin [Patescibacteria group bacterium]MBU1066289.1 pilin [Patescibacteria group bacterium]